MKYIAAYALLALSGKTDIAASDVTSFLNDIGVTPDEKTVELICNSLKGKPIHEAINEGLAKVSTLAVGGSGGNAGGNAGGDAAPAEEEKEESEEEADVSMGGLFSD